MFIPLKMVCIGIDPYPFVRALWYWVGDMLLSLIEIMQWQHANGVPTLLRLTPESSIDDTRVVFRYLLQGALGDIQVLSAKKKQFEALWSTSKHRNFHNSRASPHALVFHKPLSPGFLWVPWVSRGTKKGRILHRERSTKAVKMSWAGSKLDWPSGFFQISRWRSRWFAEALTNGHWWWWWWWLLLSLWLWLLVIIVIMIHDNHL